MRRALTLAAVGSTPVVASAAPEVSLSSIKALNTPAVDKDSFSFKGAVTGVPSDYLEALLEEGITVDLFATRSNSPVFLDGVTFDPEECKPIRNGKGASCRIDGARLTVTEAKDKKDGSMYYKITGGVHRREFEEETLDMPLSVDFNVDTVTLRTVNENCFEKEGANGQLRATCKPSPV